jgi:hypothetical protein
MNVILFLPEAPTETLSLIEPLADGRVHIADFPNMKGSPEGEEARLKLLFGYSISLGLPVTC